MPQRYQYSRRPEQPFAEAFPPLPAGELHAMQTEAVAGFRALFPAVEAAVQTAADGNVFSGSANKSLAMWTSSVVFGTIEEVAELYMGGDAVPLVAPGYQRAKQLYALQEPTKEAPFCSTSLQWALWKSGTKLADPRDLCFIEHMNIFKDSASGRRGWARAGRSANHLSCPASQHPDGPVRSTLLLFGSILRETDKFGVLECVTFVEVDSRSAPSKELVAGFKHAAHTLNHSLLVMRQFHQKFSRLDGNYISTDSSDWKLQRHISDVSEASSSDAGGSGITSSKGSSSRNCRSCDEHISKWTPAKRCRFCDAVLCKRCVELLFQDGQLTTKNYRVCMPCALRVAADGSGQRPRGGTTGSANSSLTSGLPPSSRRKPPSSSSSKGSLGSAAASVRSAETASVGDATEMLEHLELPASPANSTSSSSHSSGRRRVPVAPQRSDSAISHDASGLSGRTARSRRPSLAMALELEPERAAPVDLSYLTTLVTPRDI